MQHLIVLNEVLNQLNGVAHGKFKFKFFLNDLWYKPESLLLLLTFNKYYFAKKKRSNIKFWGANIFLYRGIVKKEEFGYVGIDLVTERKHVHVKEVISTSSLNFAKILRSTFCRPVIIIYRPNFDILQTNK